MTYTMTFQNIDFLSWDPLYTGGWKPYANHQLLGALKNYQWYE
jgi:hypothetical protein